MRFKIAVINLQSGIGVTKGYQQYLTLGWRYWFSHSGKPVDSAAQMLAAEAPDIVFVSEIDEPSRRTRHISHTEVIQRATTLKNSQFFSTRNLGSHVQEGSALVSILPLDTPHTHVLHEGIHPRVLGEAFLQTNTSGITLFVAHLSLGRKRRAQQVREIAEIVKNTSGPILLGGDFNERTDVLESLFHDAGLSGVATPGYPSWRPKHAFQALFFSKHFTLIRQYQPSTPAFSDHLPLFVELELT